jgi:hypothetical protein
MHVHENVPCTLIHSYAATKDVQGRLLRDGIVHRTHTHRAQAAQSSFNRVGDVLGGEREPWMWAGEGLDDEELLNYEVGLST